MPWQAVGYSLMPNNKDEDGLVVLVFNRKEADIRSQQQQLVESLHKILGGNQTLTVNVEGVKTMPDDQYVTFPGCLLILHVRKGWCLSLLSPLLDFRTVHPKFDLYLLFLHIVVLVALSPVPFQRF